MDAKLLARSAALLLGAVAAIQVTCLTAGARQDAPGQNPAASTAPAKKPIAQAQDTIAGMITQPEMLNSRCLVPSLGSGPDHTVQLKNGKYELKTKDDYELVGLSCTAPGVLDKKPAGIGLLVWNTGGSGTWDTFILFKRVKGKVVSTGHFSMGYSGGEVKNLRIDGGNICLDSPNMRAEFTTGNDDIGAADEGKVRPIEQAKIMAAKVWIPPKQFGGDIEQIRLRSGQYVSNDLSCRIATMHKVVVDRTPATIVVGKIMRKGSPAPHVVLFQFRRHEGKVFCDGFYNVRQEMEIAAVRNIRQSDNQPSELQFDGVGIKISPKQFQEPVYTES